MMQINIPGTQNNTADFQPQINSYRSEATVTEGCYLKI